MTRRRSNRLALIILAEMHGLCGKVLDQVDLPNILKGVVEEKGFNVRLPLEKLKPMTLPTRLQDSVPVAGNVLPVLATANTVRIDTDAIWYSKGVVDRVSRDKFFYGFLACHARPRRVRDNRFIGQGGESCERSSG